MANWEYKMISSGKGGFASPALMEKFLNDLGQENWEIISFQQPPDNPLAFHGLARRTTERDWTLEDAAKAAARVETEKLRLEFEAKFKAATSSAPAAAEEKGADFIEEKAAGDDGLRRPRDTSRDDDPDAPEDAEHAPKDEWDQLSAEDELPTFFDALKPHMRRNQRGPGMSVGLDFLAKKWKLEEADLKGALVECGLQIPADENAKPVYVEYDGDLFWVNINRRGEIWINTREKPTPVFRIVQGTRLTDEQVPAEMAGSTPDQAGAPAAFVPESRRDDRHERREAREPRQPQQGQPPREESNAPKTLLDKIRGMMRRNRHGHGWSGSFPYLTKALKLDEAQLLEQLAAQGLKLADGGEPLRMAENGITYWLNRNQRGEIWINAGRERGDDRAPQAAESAPAPEAPAPAAVEPAPLPVENILTAVRLLMAPKKRGEGVTAQIPELAAKLEKSDEQVLALLASTGLQRPASAKDKPTFAEHGGEIYWLNVNAKGQVWLNAKQSAATKKGKGRKAAE